ncbi:hypothetical protein K437DRAFT_283433 [Tilletiaria anomala UBC 951]|uniref:Low temperature requirement A n=1 Tax=Tilletiaria anomala (strain ATCC 24038 / CBS 436.72 / UBC 951) TaxID=1037660 RepID=A0A066W864_TILAU|nr:uncharacterized protein K437DRAFT_283433 [Tilletiaria anomala UBC 951]KDN49901.1 hypothetical protein K437DRAFT_283433 [Tilletiaria anomala UBC 951]
MPHVHAAHHLKYGQVKTGGFIPTEAEFDEEDLAACGPRGIRAADLRREILEAEARRIHANRRYLFRKPRASQYFRGTTLVRSNEERSSLRLELFFDLVFVGIVSVLAEEVIGLPTGASLIRYIIAYILAWFIWSLYRELNDCYWTGDIYQSVLTLFTMAMLVVFGNNATNIQEQLSDGPARATTIGAYLLAEFSIYGTQLFYSMHIKPYRAQIRAHVSTWPIAVALYIGSIFASVRPAIAMVVVGLVVEYGGWAFFYSPTFKRIMKLRYSSAVAIEHEVERMTDFCTLVLGETVYSIVSNHPAGEGVTDATGRAILALCIAFCFLMFYTLRSGSKSVLHPLRRSVVTAQAWFFLHIPLVSALTLFGDACGDFTKEQLVESAVRWILCTTYAIAMLCVWLLAMIEGDNDARGDVWVPKLWRLLPRLLVGVIAVFLPLSYYHIEEAGSSEPVGGEPAVTGEREHALRRLYEGEIGAEGHQAKVFAALSTTTILGILAAFSMATLLWEWISALDGPNTPADEAPEHMREGDAHTPSHALRTPAWRGFPTLFEPGFSHFDRGHQREQTHADSKLPAVTPGEDEA